MLASTGYRAGAGCLGCDRSLDDGAESERGGVYHASWIPLHTYWRVLSGENRELLRSAFMNMLLFYPAGLLLGGLLPSKWSFRKGMLCAAIAFAAFSLTIELNQYLLQLGNAETDDVLHNTLGAVAGFSAFRAFENNTDP